MLAIWGSSPGNLRGNKLFPFCHGLLSLERKHRVNLLNWNSNTSILRPPKNLLISTGVSRRIFFAAVLPLRVQSCARIAMADAGKREKIAAARKKVIGALLNNTKASCVAPVFTARVKVLLSISLGHARRGI